MNKQPMVTAQTKQNLIDAFWSLYCEKRIEKITIKEIAQRAGYNEEPFMSILLMYMIFLIKLNNLWCLP